MGNRNSTTISWCFNTHLGVGNFVVEFQVGIPLWIIHVHYPPGYSPRGGLMHMLHRDWCVVGADHGWNDQMLCSVYVYTWAVILLWCTSCMVWSVYLKHCSRLHDGYHVFRLPRQGGRSGPLRWSFPSFTTERYNCFGLFSKLYSRLVLNNRRARTKQNKRCKTLYPLTPRFCLFYLFKPLSHYLVLFLAMIKLLPLNFDHQSIVHCLSYTSMRSKLFFEKYIVSIQDIVGFCKKKHQLQHQHLQQQ